jgi:hypothetical protein
MPSSTASPGRLAVVRVVLSGVLAALLGGCSAIGAVRRPAPVRTADEPVPVNVPSAVPTPGTWVVQRRPEAVDVRAADVPVPPDFDHHDVRFADATHGAVLFTRCGVDDPAAGTRDACSALLYVTSDGGRTWQQRRHPQTVAAVQQIRVGPDGMILLLSGPNAWYVSTNEGRSFQRYPYTPEPPVAHLQALAGEFQLCCGDGPAELVRYADGKVAAVPAAPPLPGRLTAAVLRAERDLWAASVERGIAYTAFSADGGRTWKRSDVPGSQGGLVRLGLSVSADSSDLWLLGFRADEKRFPAVWRLDPTGWRLMPADGRPEAFRNAVPVGAGLLAVTGPLGSGLAGERWTATDWPSGGDLQLLGDGAVQVDDERDGTVWLGVGGGVNRRWAQLVLRQAAVAPPR